jgi:hypothetical protein
MRSPYEREGVGAGFLRAGMPKTPATLPERGATSHAKRAIFEAFLQVFKETAGGVDRSDVAPTVCDMW